MSFWTVDGVEMPDPSGFEWGLQDVSDSDAGRTLDAEMHKNRIAQKRTLKVKYTNPDPETVSTVLKAVNPEYISVEYMDAMENETQTRTFYLGDRAAPMRSWFVGGKRYSSLSFDLIEK